MKIIAMMLWLFPGMDAPKTIEKPVSSYEECYAEIGRMIDAAKTHANQDFKILIGCKVSSDKSDPA